MVMATVTHTQLAARSNMQIQLTKEQAEYLKRLLDEKEQEYHYCTNSKSDDYEHNKTLLSKVTAEIRKDEW